jgi:superfamily II DNA/RNA helicase
MDKKKSVDDLFKTLTRSSYNCIAIHGDKSQIERNSALEKFKQGNVPIMIGTDVIGRGIDFPNVSYIFNFDTPKNIDDYIHRIGRTGRCGSKGTSISFVNENTRPLINDLYNLLLKHNCEVPQFLYNMFYETKGKKITHKFNNRSNNNKMDGGMNNNENFMNKVDKRGGKNMMNNNFPQNQNNFQPYDNFEYFNNFNNNSNPVENSNNYNNNFMMGNNQGYYNNNNQYPVQNSTVTRGGIQGGTRGGLHGEIHGVTQNQNLNNEMFNPNVYQNYNSMQNSTNTNGNFNTYNDFNLDKKVPSNMQNSHPQKTINNNFVNPNANVDLTNNNHLLDNPNDKMSWRK